jgi:hypothetical protein
MAETPARIPLGEVVAYHPRCKTSHAIMGECPAIPPCVCSYRYGPHTLHCITYGYRWLDKREAAESAQQSAPMA